MYKLKEMNNRFENSSFTKLLEEMYYTTSTALTGNIPIMFNVNKSKNEVSKSEND